MAAVDWPYNLVVMHFDGNRRGADTDVDRTPFEDGSIKQDKLRTRAFRTRQYSVSVKLSNLKNFEAWLNRYAHGLFNFRDIGSAAPTECSVRGGQGAIVLTAQRQENLRLDGERFYEGSVEFEGYF